MDSTLKIKRPAAVLTFGLALGAALSIAAVAARAADAPGAARDKCFGVALKGKNDCAAGANSCAGTSTANYQGDAWKYVPAGTCEKTASPTSPTGFGQLAPFKAAKKSP
jgi:uncharacterized membrane protein